MSNIECFNNVLRDFVNELINIFPKYEETLRKNYNDLLGATEQLSEMTYVQEYIDSVSSYILQITESDDSIFNENDKLYFLRELNFSELWKEDMSDNTKTQIFNYLKTLYVIGGKVLNTSDNLNDILHGFKNDESIDLENLDDESKKILNVLESMSENTFGDEDKVKQYEDALSGSSIGKLASELANDINIDESKLKECNSPGDVFKSLIGNNFMGIVESVGEKIQKKMDDGELNERNLIEDAQSLMSMMTGGESLGNLFSMFQGSQSSNKSSKKTSSNTSRKDKQRDRLRKKLEMRKKNKEI
tara:strand:+ start:3758 stop:4666 length:909 start_codon:yes stop_codon:yes gene_type:complete